MQVQPAIVPPPAGERRRHALGCKRHLRGDGSLLRLGLFAPLSLHSRRLFLSDLFLESGGGVVGIQSFTYCQLTALADGSHFLSFPGQRGCWTLSSDVLPVKPACTCFEVGEPRNGKMASDAPAALSAVAPSRLSPAHHCLASCACLTRRSASARALWDLKHAIALQAVFWLVAAAERSHWAQRAQRRHRGRPRPRCPSNSLLASLAAVCSAASSPTPCSTLVCRHRLCSCPHARHSGRRS